MPSRHAYQTALLPRITFLPNSHRHRGSRSLVVHGPSLSVLAWRGSFSRKPFLNRVVDDDGPYFPRSRNSSASFACPPDPPHVLPKEGATLTFSSSLWGNLWNEKPWSIRLAGVESVGLEKICACRQKKERGIPLNRHVLSNEIKGTLSSQLEQKRSNSVSTRSIDRARRYDLLWVSSSPSAISANEWQALSTSPALTALSSSLAQIELRQLGSLLVSPIRQAANTYYILASRFFGPDDNTSLSRYRQMSGKYLI